ncbi:MAG: hypothetical protein JRH05_11410, partial [Deltaproteobacteria bacterium]|nr:hypothetical protein [Deltaproteobacteria bacterium]
VFPAKNEADLREIPEDIRSELEILTINELDSVLERVLKPAGAAT